MKRGSFLLLTDPTPKEKTMICFLGKRHHHQWVPSQSVWEKLEKLSKRLCEDTELPRYRWGRAGTSNDSALRTLKTQLEEKELPLVAGACAMIMSQWHKIHGRATWARGGLAWLMTQELQSIVGRGEVAGSVQCRLAVWLQSGSRDPGLEMNQAIILNTTLPTVTHPPSHVPFLKDSTTSQNSTSGWG